MFKKTRYDDTILQNGDITSAQSKHERKYNDDDFYDDVMQRIISEVFVFVELQKRRARPEVFFVFFKSFEREKTKCIVVDAVSPE